MTAFTESLVENTTLDWLGVLCYAILQGPEIAPGEIYAERPDFRHALLDYRPADALARLNTVPPAEALGDTLRERRFA